MSSDKKQLKTSTALPSVSELVDQLLIEQAKAYHPLPERRRAPTPLRPPMVKAAVVVEPKVRTLNCNGGNECFPEELLVAATLMAEEVINLAQRQRIDLSQSTEWKQAGLVGKNGKMTADMLAAYVLEKHGRQYQLPLNF